VAELAADFLEDMTWNGARCSHRLFTIYVVSLRV
jgi:hypothetical protein